VKKGRRYVNAAVVEGEDCSELIEPPSHLGSRRKTYL
jgi:hypothetical protein